MDTPAIGDWVNGYSPGVWQVFRVLRGFNEFRYALHERKKVSKREIVFLKRLVGSDWKPSFRTESCERSLITPLSPGDLKRVEKFLADDPEIRTAFAAYVPHPLPLIVNLTLSVPNLPSLESFARTTLERELADGIPLDRVLSLLTEFGFARYMEKFPINATIQLQCEDHEVRNGDFVLRQCRVLSS